MMSDPAPTGPMRVCVPTSVGYSLCAFQGELLDGFWCADFDIFSVVPWLARFLKPSELVVMDCFVCGDASVDVALAIYKSRIKRQVVIAVFKDCYGECICMYHFSLSLA